MLTFKAVKQHGFALRSSFFWNDEELDATEYLATVAWPNGVTEELKLSVSVDYIGHDDYPFEKADLEIVYNGNRTSIELWGDEEFSFVKQLVKSE